MQSTLGLLQDPRTDKLEADLDRSEQSVEEELAEMEDMAVADEASRNAASQMAGSAAGAPQASSSSSETTEHATMEAPEIRVEAVDVDVDVSGSHQASPTTTADTAKAPTALSGGTVASAGSALHPDDTMPKHTSSVYGSSPKEQQAADSSFA